MANTVSYNMGQIRYTTEGSYKTDLAFKAYSVETPSISGSRSYQDIILYGDLNQNNGFTQSKSYYLKLGIPRNLSYNMIFDLKLVSGTLSESGKFEFSNRNQYQEIKRFTVPRNESKDLGYNRVILFPDGGINKNATPILKMVTENPDDEKLNSLKEGDVYCRFSEKVFNNKITVVPVYFIKHTENIDTEILYKNDTLLNHTWKDSQTDDIAYFEFVFSNKVSGQNFNAILLELVRNSYDDDISYDGDDGNTYNGLYIDPKILNNEKEDSENNEEDNGSNEEEEEKRLQCHEIINLVPSGITAFSNIGVWSHPDTIMSINGEEIRIGQSGYYELNDFDITNFGIVVRGPQDRFSLDYQYKIN